MQLNPSKPFFGLFATLVLLYLVYILLASLPMDRIERICAPVHWTERVVVSGIDIFAEDYSDNVSGGFATGYQVCQEWTWGILYEERYKRLMAKERRLQQQQKIEAAKRKQGVSPSAPPPDEKPSAPSAAQGANGQ